MQHSTLKIPSKQQIAAAADVQDALAVAPELSQKSNQFINRFVADELLCFDIKPEGVVLEQ